MPKPLKLGSPLGRQLSVLYLSFREYSTIIFFCCHIFPHGDVIGNFLSCFCHGFLSFFPVSFTGEKVDFPWGPSSKCQLLDGYWFYLFPNQFLLWLGVSLCALTTGGPGTF